MINGRIPNERAIFDIYRSSITVNCPAGVGAVIDKRTVFNGCRVAVGIQRPTTQRSRIRIERAVADRKHSRVGTGNRATAKVSKVTLELALHNISGGLYADKDCSSCSVGAIRSGSVIKERDPFN